MTISARDPRVPVAVAALALFLSKNLFSSPLLPDLLDAAPSRFAVVDGAKVHYRSIGDPGAKAAVVFIHGWSCDMTSWRAQVPAFEGKARILVLDLPGHGRSDRPDVAYTMDRFAAAVEGVMRDAGVERALLVGHSMGTPVARQFLRKWPAKTLGIVAVDGALRAMFKDSAQAQTFMDRFTGPDFKGAMDGAAAFMVKPTTPEPVKAEVKRMFAGATQAVAVSAFKGMADPGIWTDDPIGVPLSVIVAKGPAWSADYFAYVRTLAPGAEIHEIPDSGHFVMMEKPEAVNPLLVSFAAKVGVVPLRAVRPGRPEDVASLESIVAALYDVISGPAGAPRDWDRFRSLFADGARLVPTGPRPAGDVGPRVLDVEGYVARASGAFATTGFYEKEAARRVERFGHIAHVFSTYEARHDPSGEPFLRGINSFQLVNDGTRWWILTIFWEPESDSVRIPAEYLPKQQKRA